MKAKQIVEELNKRDLSQEGCYDDDLWDIEKEFDLKQVKEGLDIDKHRWYETSTIVYEVKCDEEIEHVGVRAVTDCFSESMGFSDCCNSYEFFEMEKVTITSFRKKK